MIEFKQIIGRGTRLYDGKDYFTIYDFVQAHHHFNDPEWDGEPHGARTEAGAVAPRPSRHGNRLAPDPNPRSGAAQKHQEIKLADGKDRTIQHMMCHHLLERRWPAHVRRAVPGEPVRRAARVLQERDRAAGHLEQARYPEEPSLQGSRRRALARTPWPRCRGSSTLRRATCSMCWPMSPSRCHPGPARSGPARARSSSTPTSPTSSRPSSSSCCRQYVKAGVEELDQEKLSPLLKLKYNNAMADAVADLGSVEEIRDAFTGFQTVPV